MKYQAYAEYKDSGVEWLGEVPNDWDVIALKRRFRIIGGSTPKSDQDVFWDGEIIWATPSDLSKLTSLYINDSQRKITEKGFASCGTTLVPKNSIILSTRAPIGSLAITKTELCTNQGCKSLVPLEETTTKFFGYLLSISTTELNIRGKGTTFLELSGDELGAFKIPIPTISEQQQIANFLDHETAKIDTLIEKQQQLIKLLKEKRQAVISHAVTKGLNPDAPMRDSGVEWLGEVPEHWVCGSLKHYANVIDCKHITAEFFDEGIPLVSISEVKGWFVNLETAKLTNEKYYIDLIDGGRKPQAGDIIYSRNATVGEASLVAEDMPDFAIGQDVCLIRLSESALPEYALFVLKSGVIFQQLDLAMVGSTFKRINVDNIRNFSITQPPYNEQISIVNELKRVVEKYDELVSKAQATINLVSERRTALISAAVTGKIDVRYFKTTGV